MSRTKADLEPNKHIFVLDQAVINRILGHLFRCYRCGVKLNHGDMIFSKKSSNHRTNYWCIKCAIETKQYTPE